MRGLISPAKEDYVRAIFVLQEKNGRGTSSSLAEYLRLSKNTVSQMLKRLSDESLIVFKKYSRHVSLSRKGLALAKTMTFKHRLIERFLVDVLKRKPAEVHGEAHKLEHAFSQESIESMEKILGKPDEDPHGKPIRV